MRKFLRQSQPSTPEPELESSKLFLLWHNRVDTPLVNTVNQKFIYIIILYTFSLLESNMIFSVSNDGIEWSLDFGQDSVTLVVKDLVQEMTKNSQELPHAAWSLLLSQRQQFLTNHLARVPITPNQLGTHEMGDEVISSEGVQDMNTRGYQVSAVDLDDVEFYWENGQLDVDAVFRPGSDTRFSPTAFDDFEVGGVSTEKPFLLDEEED